MKLVSIKKCQEIDDAKVEEARAWDREHPPDPTKWSSLIRREDVIAIKGTGYRYLMGNFSCCLSGDYKYKTHVRFLLKNAYINEPVVFAILTCWFDEQRGFQKLMDEIDESGFDIENGEGEIDIKILDGRGV